jgi:hypothetical protein
MRKFIKNVDTMLDNAVLDAYDKLEQALSNSKIPEKRFLDSPMADKYKLVIKETTAELLSFRNNQYTYMQLRAFALSGVLLNAVTRAMQLMYRPQIQRIRASFEKHALSVSSFGANAALPEFVFMLISNERAPEGYHCQSIIEDPRSRRMFPAKMRTTMAGIDKVDMPVIATELLAYLIPRFFGKHIQQSFMYMMLQLIMNAHIDSKKSLEKLRYDLMQRSFIVQPVVDFAREVQKKLPAPIVKIVREFNGGFLI